MSSWFSELAGKAENILNKIDQNAANVLKNDLMEREQLIEVKCNGDVDRIDKPFMSNNVVSSIKRNISSNSLKLPRTPKKLSSVSPERKQTEATPMKIDTKPMPNCNEVEPTPNVMSISNASNSSRRSSCSSRTEGVQTVIEYPIEKSALETATNASGLHSSVSMSSLQGTMDEKNELMAMKIILAQVKIERDQLKSEVNDLQKQLENAQQTDVIADLTASCDQLMIDNQQLVRKVEKLEVASNSYIKTISELETAVAKLHQTEMDLSEKLTWTKSESEQAVFELQQYRSRAQHTLQMKDDMIAELKMAHLKNGTADDTEIDSHFKQIEWTEMTKERDTLMEEIKMLRNQLEVGKQFINSLEAKYNDAEMRFNASEKSLTNALKHEKVRCNQLEDSLRTQAKELKAVRDELKRQQLTASTKLHEKENELLNLRSKISQQTAAGGSMSANNTDDRIYSLTQSLVQKQNSLEMVTAERNAIRIQLEKLENQHRETMILLRQQRLPQIINVNDTDDAKSQVPNFMQENPFDTRVARRVKRAYSSLDAAGVRLGVFMRRYPLIRILVIVYVAVLHLWVMLVLLSSTPN